MELSDYEQYEIRAYFRLDVRINKVKKSIRRLKESFYDQTLLSHVVSNGLEVVSASFQIERNVIPYVDTIAAREKTVEVMLKRKRYFNDYLNYLDPADKAYLINKYSQQSFYPGSTQQADLNVLEEIYEIEDAICFMYGLPAPVREKAIDNTTLEEDFESIAAALGV